MERIAKWAKNEKFFLVILFAALAIRLYFRSPWLEDWDSVQFALALHNFSLVDHQPHPPGYPIYILLGRMLNLPLNNDTLALTILSVSLGAATTIPFYLLAKEMVGKTSAILATALFATTPVHWAASEVALSNVPGMFFTVLIALLLYKGKGSPKLLYCASLLGGLALGVRFAEYSIILALTGLVLFARKSWKDATISAFAFFLGVMIWLIPTVTDTGFQNFVSAYTAQASYIKSHDSLFSYGSTLTSRLSRIGNLFLMGYSIYFVPFLGLALWWLVNNLRAATQFNYLFATTWLSAYLIPLLFVYNLEVPRHLLPLLPPLVLASVQGIQLTKIPFAFYALLTAAVFTVGLQQVNNQHKLMPPTIASVFYVKENFNPNDTLIAASFTFRQFQYYAPEFKSTNNIDLQKDISAEYVIADSENLIKQIPQSANYTISHEERFSGPIEVFPRINQITLFVIQKNHSSK